MRQGNLRRVPGSYLTFDEDYLPGAEAAGTASEASHPA
jgi:hypothetical protein